MHYLEKHWQRRTVLSILLLPVAALFCALVQLRRVAYRRGLLRAESVGVPVVVVGNITVGGTGKTPFVLWLVETLKTAGWRPGVIARGYGGQSSSWPIEVNSGSDPGEVGDEPVLIARNSGCPVVVGPDRVRAARMLLQRFDCNVVISDDGLQHYRLARDIEIALLDGERRLGNRWCLPAGPLREPVRRLKTVDVRVVQGPAEAGEFAMQLAPTAFHNLTSKDQSVATDFFVDQPVHALAGIGNPQRFFATLRALGMRVQAHAFPDHHRYTPQDIRLSPNLPVIMTEKDAVKCHRFAGAQHWYLAVQAQVDPALKARILNLLNERRHG